MGISVGHRFHVRLRMGLRAPRLSLGSGWRFGIHPVSWTAKHPVYLTIEEGTMKSRKPYPHAFKVEAVKLVTEQHMRPHQVARDLGIDPERAFQAEGNTFLQGVERYNANPWVIPVGFRLGFTF